MYISSHKIITNNNLYNILLLFVLKNLHFAYILMFNIFTFKFILIHLFAELPQKKNQVYKYLFLPSAPPITDRNDNYL